VEGVLDLSDRPGTGSARWTETTAAATGSPTSPPSELAVLVAAVLGLAAGRGCVLLGPGLASIGAELAAAAGSWEILSVVETADPGETRPENLSRVVIAGVGTPPVLHGRFEAVAVAGGGSAGPVRAFAGALGPLGRLAIVGPEPGSEDVARAAGLRVIASDARVVVACREG
jgi:hypothetical protein